MAVTTTGAHPKALWPGVNAFFGKSYADKPMLCDIIFDRQKSDKAYEEYVEETGYGLAPVKPEAGAISYDTDRQGYTARLVNVTYGLGAAISQEAIEDNQYEKVGKAKARKLKRSMRQTKETVAANIFNRAFDPTFTGGDGSPLIATDHDTMDGTQANQLAVAADLSEASLEDHLTLVRQMTDSRGLRIQLKGTHLIVPPELEFVAYRILESAGQSGTANNDVNAIKGLGLLPGKVVVWDFLTDPDAFFIKTDADVGLIRQQRRKLALQQDNDFDTSNALMKATERYAFGWADWRGIVGSPGAA